MGERVHPPRDMRGRDVRAVARERSEHFAAHARAVFIDHPTPQDCSHPQQALPHGVRAREAVEKKNPRVFDAPLASVGQLYRRE